MIILEEMQSAQLARAWCSEDSWTMLSEEKDEEETRNNRYEGCTPSIRLDIFFFSYKFETTCDDIE